MLFLSVVGKNAPAALSRSADELRAQNSNRWQEILRGTHATNANPTLDKKND
jgi:hypothetical protein